MVIKIASYNDGGSTYNAEVEETSWTDYRIIARPNEPAEAIVTIADPTGAIMQKYNVDANDVFIGPGRITIENPAATDIYDGRILKSRFDMASRTVQLHCKDWLSQLEDPVITYEMRADLDGSGLREGTVSSRIHDERLPVQVVGAAKYMFDEGMNWVPDNTKWLLHYLVFSNSMRGKKTIGAGPYSRTLIGDPVDTETYTDDIGDLWIDDAAVHTYIDNENHIIYDYTFPLIVTESAFYVASSISGARLHLTFALESTGGDAATYAYVFADISGVERYIGLISEGTSGDKVKRTFEVSGDYLSGVVDANGWGQVRLSVGQAGADTVTWEVYYAWYEVDVEVTSDNAAHDITISHLDYIGTTTDLTLANANYGIWEGCEYCFVLPIYKHIDTAEGGTLVSGYDPLVALTAAAGIEHTSGFSTRRYENNTPLSILQDLANVDKTAFYMPIGTTALTWKSTFNDGAPDAMTDDSVIRWGGEYSFIDVRNGYILYGPKINDVLLKLDTKDITGGDPGADSKSTYGVTRSAVVKNAGVNSEYELTVLGSALVERDEDVLLFLNCDIAGLSALRLGDEVSITSTYMSLTAAKYVITYWEYSYSANVTSLRLHPRLSTKGFVQHKLFSDSIRKLTTQTDQLSADISYIPSEIET